MKINFITLALCTLMTITMSSCATLFTKSNKPVTFKGVPGTTVIDTDKNVTLVEIGQNGFGKALLRKSLKGKSIKSIKDGYETKYSHLGTKIQGAWWGNLVLGGILGMGIDAATGKMMTYKDNVVDVTLKPLPKNYAVEEVEETVVVPQKRVSRDKPGATEMERTILRWFFDSDPRGARIYYRVISSVPDEVKNTNETYLTTTPLEETRGFNIIGLTYDNSRDVTVEIKVSKRGYEDQVKRFNVRQALDQQEISSFFELVPKE